MFGDDDADPFVELFRQFVQYLAEGRAPQALRPWLGGGTLIGVGKRDSQGKTIPLDTDARPIVMGGVLRKVVCKTTFLMDKPSIQERLAPLQMAVGVKSGAEAMTHVARTWIHHNRHRRDCVLLQRDISNAYNELHPHEFLDDCFSYAPVSSKFAEYCYGEPSHLMYHGRLLTSNRGQQGCPLMGPLFCLTRRRMWEEARANLQGPPPSLSQSSLTMVLVGEAFFQFGPHSSRSGRLPPNMESALTSRKPRFTFLRASTLRVIFVLSESWGYVSSRGVMLGCCKFRLQESPNILRLGSGMRNRSFPRHSKQWNNFLIDMSFSTFCSRASASAKFRIIVVVSLVLVLNPSLIGTPFVCGSHSHTFSGVTSVMLNGNRPLCRLNWEGWDWRMAA